MGKIITLIHYPSNLLYVFAYIPDGIVETMANVMLTYNYIWMMICTALVFILWNLGYAGGSKFWRRQNLYDTIIRSNYLPIRRLLICCLNILILKHTNGMRVSKDHEVEGFVFLLAAGEELCGEVVILLGTTAGIEFFVVVGEVPLEVRVGGGVVDLAQDTGEVAVLLEGAEDSGDVFR